MKLEGGGGEKNEGEGRGSEFAGNVSKKVKTRGEWGVVGGLVFSVRNT